MKCIAVDDEPLGLNLLKDNISRVPYLELVAACVNAFDALKALESNEVDLIFMDIQMPGLSGLEFVKTLEHKPLIIFVTGYKQYALESYDLSIVDYLVKPVSMERFLRACNRARELHDMKAQLKNPVTRKPVDYFFVNADYSQVKVMFSDITWMEGLRDYIRIYLKSTNKPLIVRTSLKAIEPGLPPGQFLRFHKSYIANIGSITAVRKSSVFIQQQELPIGDTYKEEVEKFLLRGK